MPRPARGDDARGSLRFRPPAPPSASAALPTVRSHPAPAACRSVLRQAVLSTSVSIGCVSFHPAPARVHVVHAERGTASFMPAPGPQLSVITRVLGEFGLVKRVRPSLPVAQRGSRLQCPDLDVTVAPELSANAGETDKRFRVLKLGAAGSAMSFAPTRVVKRDQSYA